ncbi:hypothetical protein AB0M91_09430 [Micromonospora rifamycinica]|uniref:hypothetical protein n=1 Tax=Micromonospora rifamycinica TaxID=291594 RepID=UPI0034464FA5
MIQGIATTARQIADMEADLAARRLAGRPTRLAETRIATARQALAHLVDVAHEGGLPAAEIEAAAQGWDAEPEPTTVDDLVVATVTELAAEAGAWVHMVRLRTALPQVPRAALDDVLRRLDRGSRVVIAPESAQWCATADELAAAIRIGGQDKHLVCVE